MSTRLQQYVVAYDISCDKERSHAERCLKGWGHRIQKSVFIVNLTRSQSKRLEIELNKLKLSSGSVLMCRLQANCKIIDIGLPFVNPDDVITYIV